MNEHPEQVPEDSAQDLGRGRRWQRALLIFAIFVFAAASFYIAFIVVTWADDIFFPGSEINVSFLGLNRLPGADSPPPEAGTIDDRLNILVLGLDRRPWEPPDSPTRTDTVLVLTVEPFSGSVGIFNLPRDLLVEIPNTRGGYFRERINVAYQYGALLRHPQGKVGLVTDTVQHNFGIKIDYHIVVDFLDFVALVDVIGGVEVDVPRRLAAWYSIDDLPQHHVWMEFEPGRRNMDGETALAYVRIREGSDDLDRIKRQQQLMLAALKKALDVRLFLEAPSLWDKYYKAIDTNIPAVKVPGLALLARKVSQDKIVTASLGDAAYSCSSPVGASLLCTIPERVEELKRQVFFDPRLRGEGATVEVLNGSGRPALANSVVRYLVRQGLLENDLMAGNIAVGSNQPQTLIVDLKGKKYTAEKLAEWLGVPKERIRNGVDPSTLPNHSQADIVVILGADARLPTS